MGRGRRGEFEVVGQGLVLGRGVDGNVVELYKLGFGLASETLFILIVHFIIIIGYYHSEHHIKNITNTAWTCFVLFSPAKGI